MVRYQPALALIGRILLAAMFILSGWGKISGYAGTQQYMASMGVPGALLPLVILVELGAGILVVLGFYTRIAALALAAFCVASGVLVHFHPGDQAQMINFQKNIAIAGGFLVLVAFGAGRWSLDARRDAKI